MSYRDDIPIGEFHGNAKKNPDYFAQTEKEKIASPENAEVVLHLFPMPIEFAQGVGILKFDNHSYKIFWESNNTNKEKYWDIYFNKDNNIYSDINETFSFTGVIEQMEAKVKLTGSLRFKTQTAPWHSDYSIEVYKYMIPKILSESLAVTAGESFIVNVENIGKLGDFKVELSSDDGKTQTLKTLDISPVDDKRSKAKNITVTTDSDLEKKDYTLQIKNEKDTASNKIKLTVQ